MRKSLARRLSRRAASSRIASIAAACVYISVVSRPAILRGQSAAELRDLLAMRTGATELLRVPERDEDLPQPRLAGGSLDPRFAITRAKVRLGKLLFFDPIRSTDIRPEFGGLLETAQTASCGSCHMGEAATKAAAVVAMGVGGEGRHETDHQGHHLLRRRIMSGAEDTIPTAQEVIDGDGEVIQSGRFDAVDSPPRVSPSVIGFAYNQRLLWGGEAGEPNAEGYPAQEDLVRIASRAHRMASDDVSHLASNAVYVELFADAFPEEDQRARETGDIRELISFDTQIRAIAAFLRTVITRDTPWDRFLSGDDAALTPAELRGAWLFAAPVELGGADCISCHSGPALNKVLGDETGESTEPNFHNLGTSEHPLFAMSRNVFGDPALRDRGRGGVTGDPAQDFAFKTPTLRQVRDAAPFFHGGSASSVREVIEYFNAGVAQNAEAGAEASFSPRFSHPRGEGTLGLGLPSEDVDALVEFLERALYDPGLVHDDPDSPTRAFELTYAELDWPPELEALGAVDGWLPSGLPNGFNDPLSRSDLVFLRGDANADARIDLSDSVRILDFLFATGGAPRPMVAGDANDDSRVDIADPIYLLGFLFLGGPPPHAPWPEAGQDLTR